MIAAGERGPRDRQPYSLTPSGRTAFAAWIEREPGDETVRFPLLLTLAFGRFLPPERIAAFVAHHRAVHAPHLERYQAIAAGIPPGDAPTRDPYALATLSFGIHYERAVLAWFDGLPESVRGSGPCGTWMPDA